MSDPAPGITAVPHEENLRYFDVTITGPEGCPFAGSSLSTFLSSSESLSFSLSMLVGGWSHPRTMGDRLDWKGLWPDQKDSIRTTRCSELFPTYNVVFRLTNYQTICSVFNLGGFDVRSLIGGKFKLELFLPDGYPMEAPKVRFLTKIYHPNIGLSSLLFLGLSPCSFVESWLCHRQAGSDLS